MESDYRTDHETGHVWQAVIDRLAVAIALLDSQGRVVEANPAFRSLAGAVGHHPVADRLPDWLTPVGQEGWPFGARPLEGREAFASRSGERWYEVSIEPLGRAVSTEPAAVVIVRETTETRHAQERARQAETVARSSADRAAALERELQQLRQFFVPIGTTQLFGGGPMRGALPIVFEELTGRFMDVLRLALEQSEYKVKHNLSEKLRTIGDRLGCLGAVARDVIDLYVTAVERICRGVPPAKAGAYIEEGRLLVLELMGHLLSYYRLHSLATLSQREVRPGVSHGKAVDE